MIREGRDKKPSLVLFMHVLNPKHHFTWTPYVNPLLEESFP